MAETELERSTGSARRLLKVARYLSRPQQFVSVADARAELKRTLARVKNSSVVLTSNGEPAAALVPFSTLEAMRGALMQLLVNEIEKSLDRTRLQAAEGPPGQPANDEEFESMARAAVRKARRQPQKRVE